MKKPPVTIAALFVISSALAVNVNAKKPNLEYDQDVTPDVIFGSGNANGAFTTHRRKGIEVGLRAKQRFPVPANTFNSNGDGTYSFPAGDACPGFGFAPFPLCLTTPLWSFEWSVNTDYAGDNFQLLSAFHYELGMDSDPGPGTRFTVFDNITPSLVAPLFDHAFGDNLTTNGAGVSASTPLEYQGFLDAFNGYHVTQNSWNYEFFNTLGTSLESFDPSVDGNYLIYLRVLDPDKCKILAESRIQILVGDAKRIKDRKRRRKHYHHHNSGYGHGY